MLLRNTFVKMEEAGDDGAASGAGGENTPTLDDLQTQLNTLTETNQKLTAHNEILFNETKVAKKKATELESASEKTIREAAEKNGDYKQLHESSELEREKLSDQLTELTGKVSRREVQNAALKLASELADGTNVELLSDFVSRRLKHTDEGLKVIDSAGNLTVATIGDLKKEFAGDARYASLLKGNKSSGGGATGNNNSSGGAAKEIDRPTFDSMDQVSRQKFFKGGGKVI